MARRKNTNQNHVEGSEKGFEVSGEQKINVSNVEMEAALKHMKTEDEEMVQLVNLTMGNATVWIPKGIGSARAVVKPFMLTPPVPRSFANKILKRKPPSRFDPQRYVWHELPAEAEGQPEMKSFVDKNSGQTVYTSTHRPLSHEKRPDGEQLYHSVSQAQHLVARMRTVEAIRRYIREFDPRPQVSSYAALVMDFRERSRLDRMGLGSQGGSNLMN